MDSLEAGLSRPSVQRYVVLGWLCLAAAISYACRNVLGVCESTVRAEFFGSDASLDSSKQAMGFVMSLFFVPYALGQIPGGWFADRVGSRVSISLCAVGWSCATLLMGLSTGIWLLAILYLFNGLFQAGLFPACTKSLSRWFPSNRRAVASGGLASAMSLGSAAASAIAGLLLNQIGWRGAFLIFGTTGLIWVVCFFRWFRDRPEDDPRVNSEELILIRGPEVKVAPDVAGSEQESERAVWWALLLSPATWFICGQQFCRAGGQIFFSTWFPTYLQEARSISVEISGLLNSLPILALVVGALSGGLISDWVLTVTGSRRAARQGVASTCMVICAISVFISSSIGNSLAAVLVISAGMLFAAIGGPAAYAITIDMGGRHIAKLFGCMNMVGNLGAIVIPIIVPKLLNQHGQWNNVLVMFCVLWGSAGLFWLLLNPNGTVFQQSLWRNRQVP